MTLQEALRRCSVIQHIRREEWKEGTVFKKTPDPHYKTKITIDDIEADDWEIIDMDFDGFESAGLDPDDFYEVAKKQIAKDYWLLGERQIEEVETVWCGTCRKHFSPESLSSVVDTEITKNNLLVSLDPSSMAGVFMRLTCKLCGDVLVAEFDYKP